MRGELVLAVDDDAFDDEPLLPVKLSGLEHGEFSDTVVGCIEVLLDLLRALRFPQKFIGWIRECICTPKFSLNINGEMTGFFGSARGLRQGDPISPYLFVLVMEALTRLLNQRVEEAN